MSAQWWLTLCQVAEIVAIIVALLAAIGTYHFSSKVDQQKDRQITELEETAKQLRQGKIVVYYQHGEKDVVTGPGRINRITNGPEVQVFNQMMALQEQQDFPGLLALADDQITKTGPQWLSPYLFMGVALVKLGRRDEGIETLRFVAREAPDDEDFYKQAAKFLRDLGVEP